MDTIFHNYPCPAVFLHRTIDQTGHSTYHVVDGKQRLQTILWFVEDKVRIPKTFGDIRLDGKRWSQLNTDERQRFWNYVLTVEMLPSVDDAIVNNVFERINRNARKLTSQELRHAKYDGWFVNAAEAESEKEEWKALGVVTTARAKRMADVQFLSELMIIILKKEIAGFDQDYLDGAYAEYDAPVDVIHDFSEEDFSSELEEAKRFILRAIAQRPEIRDWLKSLANLYSMWGYMALSKPDDMDAEDFAQRYAAFMDGVDYIMDRMKRGEPTENIGDQNSRSYAYNMRGAITDAGPRQARHDALRNGLRNG